MNAQELLRKAAQDIAEHGGIYKGNYFEWSDALLHRNLTYEGVSMTAKACSAGCLFRAASGMANTYAGMMGAPEEVKEAFRLLAEEIKADPAARQRAAEQWALRGGNVDPDEEPDDMAEGISEHGWISAHNDHSKTTGDQVIALMERAANRG